MGGRKRCFSEDVILEGLIFGLIITFEQAPEDGGICWKIWTWVPARSGVDLLVARFPCAPYNSRSPSWRMHKVVNILIGFVDAGGAHNLLRLAMPMPQIVRHFVILCTDALMVSEVNGFFCFIATQEKQSVDHNSGTFFDDDKFSPLNFHPSRPKKHCHSIFVPLGIGIGNPTRHAFRTSVYDVFFGVSRCSW